MLRVLIASVWLLLSCSNGSTREARSRSDSSTATAAGSSVVDDVARWLLANGSVLETVEPGHGFADLSAFGSMVGDARVVGLGEATHGNHEFQRLKHRLIEYLVSEKGFSIVAIEANQPECRAINEYVLHGKGDARTALEGIYFWSLNTEEMLALIEWMRAWNAEHEHKVQFAGFDMQRTEVARENVAAFVERVEPARARTILKMLASTEPSLAALADLAKRFDASQVPWTAATDPVAYATARHDLAILQQQAARRTESTVYGRFEARDRAMADNIEWLLAQQPREARMIVWAHNVHVALDLEIRRNMGHHVRKRLGGDYVAFGFLFGYGNVRALGDDVKRGSLEFSVERAGDDDITAPFALTRKSLLIADLRKLPAYGPVRDWFDLPQLGREVGALFSEIRTPRLMFLTTLYDAVIYIDHVTGTRPYGGGAIVHSVAK
jgi:erythromycin esterase